MSHFYPSESNSDGVCSGVDEKHVLEVDIKSRGVTGAPTAPFHAFPIARCSVKHSISPLLFFVKALIPER